jgi:hypothetical protein
VLALAATAAAAELVGVAVLPGVLLVGLAGVGAVVAIGSAVIALGGRRTPDEDPLDDEEVLTAPRP